MLDIIYNSFKITEKNKTSIKLKELEKETTE